MTLTEWELWACASRVLQDYGEDAMAHCNKRMICLLEAGDEAGALTWAGIANRLASWVQSRSDSESVH